MSDQVPIVIAQVTPTDSNVVAAATKKPKDKWLITSIDVVNTDSSTRTYSIFVDKDGTTANATTAISSAASLAANTRTLLEWVHGLPVDKAANSGTLSVQASAGNVVTFTIAGYIY